MGFECCFYVRVKTAIKYALPFGSRLFREFYEVSIEPGRSFRSPEFGGKDRLASPPFSVEAIYPQELNISVCDTFIDPS